MSRKRRMLLGLGHVTRFLAPGRALILGSRFRLRERVVLSGCAGWYTCTD
jgi:hypothetical protein